MVNLMMDAALSMLNSWEEKVESVEGKGIFYKIRQLQKLMGKRSMLIGVRGSRYVQCIHIIFIFIYDVFDINPRGYFTYYDGSVC